MGLSGRTPGDREDPTAWLRLAERTVELAQAAGADQSEARVDAGESALTRFANSEIHQNVIETDASVSLRFVVGGRIAVVSSGRTDEEGLRRLVERAAGLARVVEPLASFRSLPEPGPGPIVPAPGAYVAATAEATPAGRAAAITARTPQA